MTHLRISFVMFFALVGAPLVGCGSESEWMPPAGPESHETATRGVWIAGAPGPGPASSSVIYPLPPGTTVPLRVGEAMGYQLLAIGPGAYRFRWTGDFLANHESGRKFQGSVFTRGHFTSVTPGCDDGSCPLEEGEDYLSPIERVQGGERIRWDTVVWNGWDGFSFKTDAEPLYLELYVEGRSRPDLLEFIAPGGTGTPPSP
jgi:hypothetical protein